MEQALALRGLAEQGLQVREAGVALSQEQDQGQPMGQLGGQPGAQGAESEHLQRPSRT